jgi:small subunit ribosomal protein S2
MKKDGTFLTLSKKERLQVDRLRAKLEKNLGSISEMTRLPGALFIVDTMREHIAVKEAIKLNIPIFAMADTNSDPRLLDYIIPSNDDASKSIEAILSHVTEAIAEGLSERKSEKTSEKEGSDEEQVPKKKKVETKKVVSEEKEAEGDDLTKVEGIGPKISKIFQESGINTFANLADKTEAELSAILTEAGSKYASKNPASWPKQAKMAADGKWDDLKEWQDNAKGGIEE